MNSLKKISDLIGEDINNKLLSKNISRSFIHKKHGICSEPTFLKILRGDIKNVIPMSKILEIYRAIGEEEIDIKGDNFSLYIKLREDKQDKKSS